MTEKQYLKQLGRKIQLKREKLGRSREELANQVGLTRVHIYRIENGMTPTTIIALRRIAGYLQISLSKLVNSGN